MTPEEMQAMQREWERSRMTHQPPGPSADPSGATRAFAQGLTFGGADEAEAWLRSQLNGEDYSEALADVRGKLAKYRQQDPGGALFGELAGGALPAIVGGIAAAPAKAIGVFPTLARLAGVGALEGAGYGFLAGEGGFGPRMANAGEGAVVGGLAGGALGAAGMAAGATFNRFMDTARRTMGRRAARTVEREIRKAVEDSGMTMQEAIDGIVNGRLLADNKTIASVARAYRAQSAEAAAVLENTYRTRPGQLRDETMEYMRGVMSGADDPNVVRAQQFQSDAAKRAMSADYERAFQGMPVAPDEVQSGVARSIARRPRAAQDLQDIYRAETGRAPFFEFDDAGNVVMRRPVSLEDAEIVRRGLADDADVAYTRGRGTLGGAVKNVEGDLRGLLDMASPELAAVRSNWAKTEASNAAFEAGRKALARSADDIEVEFAKVMEQGPESVKAYRSGVFAALKNRASTGSGKSLPANIASEERKEGLILRTVFPQDELPDLLRRATNAADAQGAANQLLGGSDTAITQGRLSEQLSSVATDAMEAMSANPSAALRLAGSVAKMVRPGMTPKQAAEAARLMVESDPHVVARALTDQGALDALYNVASKVVGQAQGVGAGIGGAIGGVGSSLDAPGLLGLN